MEANCIFLSAEYRVAIAVTTVARAPAARRCHRKEEWVNYQTKRQESGVSRGHIVQIGNNHRVGGETDMLRVIALLSSQLLAAANQFV